MKKPDLIALLHGEQNPTVPNGCKTVAYGSFVAVFSTVPSLLQKTPRRRSIVKRLVERQKILECLAAQSTTLAFLPGTQLEPKHMGPMVDANATLLSALVKRYQGKSQFQISVAWNEQAAAQRFGWTNEAEAEQWKHSFMAQAREAIDAVATDLIELPRQEDMLLNAAVLVRAQDQTELDKAVQSIDSVWSEGFAIRQIGPSPAISFCSLRLRDVSAKQTAEARVALKLTDNASADAIDAARRQALMQKPPEQHEKIKEYAAICHAANQARQDRFPQLLVWSEGRATGSLDIKRVA